MFIIYKPTHIAWGTRVVGLRNPICQGTFFFQTHVFVNDWVVRFIEFQKHLDIESKTFSQMGVAQNKGTNGATQLLIQSTKTCILVGAFFFCPGPSPYHDGIPSGQNLTSTGLKNKADRDTSGLVSLDPETLLFFRTQTHKIVVSVTLRSEVAGSSKQLPVSNKKRNINWAEIHWIALKGYLEENVELSYEIRGFLDSMFP